MARWRSKTRLGRHSGRIRQQYQRHCLGQLFRKRIVEHKSVVPTLILRDIVSPLRDLIGLALPDPFDLFQSNPRKFLDNRQVIVTMSSTSHSVRRQVLIRVDALRVGARYGGMSGMLKDAEIQGFLMRLDAPGKSMVGFDVYPTDEVRLHTNKITVNNDTLTLEPQSMTAAPYLPCCGLLMFPCPPWLRSGRDSPGVRFKTVDRYDVPC